jgi:general secretion pathway protein D
MDREMKLVRRVVPGLVLALLGVCAPSTRGQTAAATRPAATTTAPVTLDFPADGVELKTLTDIVTRRLGIPILYDETINNKRVIIRVPIQVPESSLLGILQSALRMKQLVLVDAEQPGWKQIVPAQNLPSLARAAKGAEPGAAITQAFVLKNVDAVRAGEAIRPFLTQPGGNVQPVTGQRILIVSDYPAVMEKIEQILKVLDTDAPGVEVRFVQLKNSEAGIVAALVTQVISNREGFQWGNPAASGIFLAPDERSNQVVVVAPIDKIASVVQLVEQADKPAENEVKVYRLKNISPERIDRLVKDQLGTTGRRLYQGSVDRDSRALVVTAPTEIQRRIEALVKELDVPVTAEQSPIRFYKLKNTKATDVLATISGLVGEGESAAKPQAAEETPSGERTGVLGYPTSRPSSGAAGTLDATTGALASTNPPTTSSDITRAPGAGLGAGAAPGSSSLLTPMQAYGEQLPSGQQAGVSSVRTANATVAADVNTNSIIVIAPPNVQQIYEQLIQKLDQRRPQVQIECTIVTLDTSDNYSYGVDVAVAGGSGQGSIITFGAFGVSTLDPTVPSLTPKSSPGGTFALLNPAVADVVIHALSSNSKARLISAPQVLVNDNGKGSLKSVSQEPFAEVITNASVAQQGLGGLAEAGTTILVEPHISEDDYLQLGYSIELSNFTGASSNGLPPPSQKNAVESIVTIPDGYTIVVGGLAVKNLRKTNQGIPIIDQIPIIKDIIGSHASNKSDTTLFVFIKPVILRDDKFQDLRYLSDKAVKRAEIPENYPQSRPIPIH